MYVDLDKNIKPVGAEVWSKKKIDSINKQINQSLTDLEDGARFKEFAIDEFIIELKKRYGECLEY
jgi:hypothetical protein